MVRGIGEKLRSLIFWILREDYFDLVRVIGLDVVGLRKLEIER